MLPQKCPNRVALTIAGSDPSGGAGLQADLKTFQQHHVFGCSAITLITVQNTQGVSRVEFLAPDLVAQQIQAVLDDFTVSSVKSGALGNKAILEVVAEFAEVLPNWVVDPVMISKHGHPLMDRDAIQVFREKLLPNAYVLTPNCYEATELTGIEIRCPESMRRAGQALLDSGTKNVYLKGGRFESGRIVDLALTEDHSWLVTRPLLETRNLHGSGCVLSAAIAARLARGESFNEAVEEARSFVQRGIDSGPGLGKGIHPLNFCSTVEL